MFKTQVRVRVSKDGSLHCLTFELPAGFTSLSVFPENIGEVLVSATYPDGKSVFAKLVSDDVEISFEALN